MENEKISSTCSSGRSSPRASKRGRRTRPMKLTWDDGLVTLSRSMKGVTGRPSSFSASLCLKNSCRSLSNHGSATSIGRASLLMSATLIRIMHSCKKHGSRLCCRNAYSSNRTKLWYLRVNLFGILIFQWSRYGIKRKRERERERERKRDANFIRNEFI